MIMGAHLLDLYPISGGLRVWLLKAGRAVSHDLPFYPEIAITGPPAALRRAEAALRATRCSVHPQRATRKELFSDSELDVLRILIDPLQYQRAVRLLDGVEGLQLWNADIGAAEQFLYQSGLFPLAPCAYEVGPEGTLAEIAPREDPWQHEYTPPELRIAFLQTETRHPTDRRPGALMLRSADEDLVLEVTDPREVIQRVNAFLRRNDPDVILTRHGDAGLLPNLCQLSATCGVPLHLNRDPQAAIRTRRPRSYWTYGQVIYQPGAQLLAGRCHIDLANSFIFDEAELAGLIELARLSQLPLQSVARATVGSAVSSMQVALALRRGYLVPWRKSQIEEFKTADHLVQRDKGGLVYQPETGAYESIGELDFSAMYPAIMDRYNVSPETVNCPCCVNADVPELGYTICRRRRGIVADVNHRIVERRTYYKERKHETTGSEREIYDARQTALKWIGVVSFGFLGYRNARFGRIEAHEAMCAYSREMLLRAKEVAEVQGFHLLHALVDSLWLSRPGAGRDDYERLAVSIQRVTDLPILVEGVYRWVVFAPARLHPTIGVPNRYFGVFSDGTTKIRGIEVRRSDVPAIVHRMQAAMLAVLFEADDLTGVRARIPRALEIFDDAIFRLRHGDVSAEDLAVRTTLSQAPDEYVHMTPQAVAARKLARAGMSLHPGEAIRFIVGDADARVIDDRAYPLGVLPVDWTYDIERYVRMLRRAAETILDPFHLGVVVAHLQHQAPT